jgi:uncharacterized protein
MQMPELKAGYQELQISMNNETVRDAVDYARAVGLKDTNLTFFGGEPLLRFDLLREAVEYAEKCYPDWFVFNVITNATLLTTDMADLIKKHNIRFLFSIDGDKLANDRLRIYKTGKGSVFEDAWKNIRDILVLVPELEYKINITYFRPTMDLAGAFTSLLSLGVPETRFERGLSPKNSEYIIRMEDVEIVKKSFSMMAEEYLKHLLAGGTHIQDNFVGLMRKIAKQTPRLRGCNMGVDYITIAVDGSVYPCHKLVGHKDFCMGNVHAGTQNERYYEIWENNVLYRSLCAECEDRFLCGGFCICDNLFHSGNFFLPTPENCEIIRHNITLALWLYNELENNDPSVLKRLLASDYWMESDCPIVTGPLEINESGYQIRHLGTGGEYELNSTAVFIFNACDGVKTVGMIARQLSRMTGISFDSVLSDVRQQLGIFHSAKIVDFVSTTACMEMIKEK